MKHPFIRGEPLEEVTFREGTGCADCGSRPFSPGPRAFWRRAC
jgi:hypothetical protein